MTVHLEEIVDLDLFDDMINEGYIRVQSHPNLPYHIYCYTHLAMQKQEWNRATRIARGLIVHSETDEVIARPFSKFFNYDEPAAPEVAYHEWGNAYDKLDGSLGIVYPMGDGNYAVATKGSFTSPQAVQATRMWRQDIDPTGFQPPRRHTVLVEIIYPENRIVLDYQGQEKLILLGLVQNSTGLSHAPEDVLYWPGEKAEWLGAGEYRELLDHLPRDRPNSEGMVLHFPGPDLRVKVKQPDYLERHKAVFDLSEHSVWVTLKENRFEEFVSGLDEEHQTWAHGVRVRLDAAFDANADLVESAWDTWMGFTQEMKNVRANRKQFAGWVNGHYLGEVHKWWPGAMFLMYDVQNDRLDEALWNSVRPSKVKVFNG